MSSIAENNRRIAKNTAIMYGRMILVMIISIYSSRVILKVLGVEDYGTYNVVGGFVGMLSVLNSSMSGATFRFITLEVAKKSPIERVREYFSASLTIHVVIGLLVVLLSETIGLWWIDTKLNVTADRLPSAMIAYHLFVIQSFFVITNAPYQALYEVHERFDLGSGLGFLEVLLRFGAVLILDFFPGDRLEIYALLLFIVALFMTILRKGLATRLFQECRFRFTRNKSIYKELLSFSSLTLAPSIVSAVATGSIDLVINTAFSSVANAAKGIALQVQGALWSFVGNVQAPAGPGIIKYYGEGRLDEMKKLAFRLGKLSLFIFLILSLPVSFEIHNILNIWLEEVPPYTEAFVLLMLLGSLLNAFIGPIGSPINATGKIKRISFFGMFVTPFNLLFTYIAFQLGYPPYTQVAVTIITSLGIFYVRLKEVQRLFGYHPMEYVSYAFLKPLPVLFLSVILPAMIVYFFEPTVYRLLINSALTVSTTAFFIFRLGLTADEKAFVLRSAQKLLDKYQPNRKWFKNIAS